MGIKDFARPASWKEDEAGGVRISTDLFPIERRVDAACAVAKWNKGTYC